MMPRPARHLAGPDLSLSFNLNSIHIRAYADYSLIYLIWSFALLAALEG